MCKQARRVEFHVKRTQMFKFFPNIFIQINKTLCTLVRTTIYSLHSEALFLRTVKRINEPFLLPFIFSPLIFSRSRYHLLASIMLTFDFRNKIPDIAWQNFNSMCLSLFSRACSSIQCFTLYLSLNVLTWTRFRWRDCIDVPVDTLPSLVLEAVECCCAFSVKLGVTDADRVFTSCYDLAKARSSGPPITRIASHRRLKPNRSLRDKTWNIWHALYFFIFWIVSWPSIHLPQNSNSRFWIIVCTIHIKLQLPVINVSSSE